MDLTASRIIWCVDMLHKKGGGTLAHDHKFYHYVYVREGEGRAVIGGVPHALLPHTFYLFQPGVEHEFRAHTDLRLYEVKFEIGDASLAAHLAQLPSAIKADAATVERLFPILIAEGDACDELSRDYRAAVFFELLASLCRWSERSAREGALPRAVAEALAYMKEHLGEEIKNEDLATLVHLERTYLIKQFKKYLGAPPRAYLMELRMKEATSLIRNSDMNLTQIADAVGFKSLHHFSNAFKAHTGVSPSHYRENRSQE